MKCPYCGGKTGIWKTRSMPDGRILRERRCGRRGCRVQFVTVERFERLLGSRMSTAQVRKRKPRSGPLKPPPRRPSAAAK